MLKRNVIDNSDEEFILTSLITNDNFCQQVVPLLNLEYFKSDYIRKAAKWCVDYFNQYEKAIDVNIQEYFNFESKEIDESEAGAIAKFLSKLSDAYERKEKQNISYLIDKAISYFNKRNFELTIERATILSSNGKLDDAELELLKYKSIVKETTNWINPFDPEAIDEVWDEKQQSVDNLFCLPGKLGKLIGTYQRGQVVCILGAFKVGKSWFLQEHAIIPALEKCKVAYISLEMSDREVRKRMHKRFVSRSEEEENILYPVFDCVKNQNNSCFKKERTNKIRLPLNGHGEPEYDPKLTYSKCVYCRFTNPDEFEPAVWYEMEIRSKINSAFVKREMEAVKKWNGDNIRIIAYPSFSANIQNIKTDLDKLEYLQGFIPDVILIDYVGILAPEDKRMVSVRDRLDESWKSLKNLAATRKCLIVSVQQVNRPALKKQSLGLVDTAEDIRVAGNVDIVYTLNQLPREKKAKTLRVGVVASRNKEFDPSREVLVLQQLTVGQALIDSEFIKISSEESDEEERPKRNKRKE